MYCTGVQVVIAEALPSLFDNLHGDANASPHIQSSAQKSNMHVLVRYRTESHWLSRGLIRDSAAFVMYRCASGQRTDAALTL